MGVRGELGALDHENSPVCLDPRVLESEEEGTYQIIRGFQAGMSLRA